MSSLRFDAAESGAADAGGNADDKDDGEEEEDAAEAGERKDTCAAIESAGRGCAVDALATPMAGENELQFDAPACRPEPAGRPTSVDCATRPDWNCCCALPCGAEKEGKPFSVAGSNSVDDVAEGGGAECGCGRAGSDASATRGRGTANCGRGACWSASLAAGATNDGGAMRDLRSRSEVLATPANTRCWCGGRGGSGGGGGRCIESFSSSARRACGAHATSSLCVSSSCEHGMSSPCRARCVPTEKEEQEKKKTEEAS